MLVNFRFSLAPILMLALAGCPPGKPDAIIHYTEVGACTQANFNGNQVNAGQNQAIVIFNVSSIDNSQVNTTWAFDVSNFAVNPPSSQQSNLGGTGPVSIAAQQNVSLSGLQGFVGIIVSTANANGSDAATTNYFLLYTQPQGSQGPGTIGEKANSGTSFPFTQSCNSLAGQ
jgi:hypothetical protein